MEKVFIVSAINVFNAGQGAFAIEGRASGSVKVGDSLVLTDFGGDDDVNRDQNVSVIEIGLRKGSDIESVTEAKNTAMIVYFTCPNPSILRTGVVLHDKEATYEDIYGAYKNAIGNIYAAAKELELNDTDKKILRLTDAVEAADCFKTVLKTKEPSKENKKKFNDRLDEYRKLIIARLLTVKKTYAVCSKITGDPYMFNNVILMGKDKYSSSLPVVMLVTCSRKAEFEKALDPNDYYLIPIEREALKPFLGVCFFANGAYGVTINGDSITLPVEMFGTAKPEDDENMSNFSNPEFERWNLILAQVTGKTDKDSKIKEMLASENLGMQLLSAKFLVPAQPEGEGYRVATQEGKGERRAVRMYTDWTKLRKVYDGQWGGIIRTIGDMIEEYDVFINPCESNNMSLYFTEAMYKNFTKGKKKK